jgi:hypothetical protein
MMPTAATQKSQGLKAASCTASNPATAAAVIVIGCAHARVMTSQRVPQSVGPGGGLQVESA